MKKIIYILIVVITQSVFAQKNNSSTIVDYSNFDYKLFEKTLFDELNTRRVAKGREKLVWSNVLYKEASKRNVKIMSQTDALKHPDYSQIWDSLRVRDLLAKESDRVIGGKASRNSLGDPFMTYYENAEYRTFERDITYMELVKRTIDFWETSYFHDVTQYMSYISVGKPGLASCSASISKSNKLYIVFHFVEVYRSKRKT